MAPKAKGKAKAKAEASAEAPRRRRDVTSIDEIVKDLAESQRQARAQLRQLRAERKRQVARQQRLNKKARGLTWRDLTVLAELKGIEALENVSKECQTAAAAAAARVAAAAATPPPEAEVPATAPAAGGVPAGTPHTSGGSDSDSEPKA